MKSSVMRISNITVVGLRAIARNKMRSFLTALGIIIGVGCVIAVVAIGNGAAKSVENTINSLGTNYIMLFPGAATSSGARMFTGNSTLTADDADAIKAECPAVAYVSPTVRATAQVVAGELNWGTSIQGVSVDYPLIRSWNVSQGTFFSDQDVKSASKVCVLGTTVADNLFSDGQAINQIVRIKNVPFKVLGVLEKKGGNMMGQDQDDTIVAPYTTVMKRLSGKTKIDMIQLSAVSADQVQQAQNEVDSVLRQRHRISPNGDPDFQMRSQEEIAQAQGQQTAIMRLLLLVIAGISLLVGGIGIMNIMLVSVTARTREIGLRMALGARRSDVITQFVAEAVLLSIVGGLLGTAVGALASGSLEEFFQYSIDISILSSVMAIAVAVVLGVIFGVYPARRAAGLDPIEALHHE